MITQSIRTGKYTTTIDIPAEKLQTKSKYIQISKSTSPQYETITIPNTCCQKQQEIRQINLQTKLVIEELEQAYNVDVKALESRISQMKTSNDIEKLKLENLVEYQKRQMEIYKKLSQEADQKINNANAISSLRISNLEAQIKNIQGQVYSKNNLIQRLEGEIVSLKKDNSQKDQLLNSRFRQFQTQKDRKFAIQRQQLEQRILQSSRSVQQLQKKLDLSRESNEQSFRRISGLQKQYHTLEGEKDELRKLNDFQAKQIEQYIINLKHLQKQNHILQQDKQNLHQKIEEQNSLIQRLRDELRLHSHALDKLNSSSQSQDNQVRVLAEKVVQYQDLISQKQKEFVQSKTQYLLKLKEIDEQRQYSKKVEEQLGSAHNQIKRLSDQLATFSRQQQSLKNQLTKKILQNNDLLSRPPEQSVYEVRIEKSIDRKQYIEELQSRLSDMEKVNQSLKEDNQSYVEQIKRKYLQEKESKKREQNMQESIQQLKKYIAVKQKSIAWVTEREISKDVEINKDNSSDQKTNSYRVYVQKSSSSKSYHSQQVSGIQKNQDINFSVQSRIQNILQQKHVSSVIQRSVGNQN